MISGKFSFSQNPCNRLECNFMRTNILIIVIFVFHNKDIQTNLQIFSDYQMQQMSDNFIDSFGFNDEEFNDGDDGGG